MADSKAHMTTMLAHAEYYKDLAKKKSTQKIVTTDLPPKKKPLSESEAEKEIPWGLRAKL